MNNPWEDQQHGGGNENGPLRMPEGMPTGPAVPPAKRRGIWYAWKPLVIKYVVSIAVSMLAVMGYTFYYISKHAGEMAAAMHSQQDMLEFSLSISEKMLQYTTQLEGLSALIVIPIMLYMFHGDRMYDKMAGVAQNRKAPLVKYAAVIGIAAAMCVGLNNLILISDMASYSAAFEQTSESLYSAPFAMQILCLGVLVPICEELVFRGLMFRRMRGEMSFLGAAFYSSLVFAVLHGNMVQMLYAFATGMMLAYVYEKYGSVRAPAAAHIVMNLISVTATQFGLYGWLLADKLRIGAVTVVCAAFAATMFLLIQRIDEKPAAPGGTDETNRAV